jgi:ABC-type glycerol-3-phosphate transport system permease component
MIAEQHSSRKQIAVPQGMTSRQLRKAIQRFIIYGLLTAGAILVMIPFFWLLRTSLMWEGDIFLYPPRWLPIPPIWENYVTIFANPYIPLLTFWKNSIVLAFWSVIGDLFSASLVGFSLSRLRWRGRNVLFAMVIVMMFLPGQITIIPTYILYGWLGWLNTLLPLIVASWVGHPFYIFLMRQFTHSIPLELDDAARIDGCNTFGIYWRIVLPLTKPALAAIAIFAFQNKWNQFFEPLIFINTKENLPLAVGLYFFRGMVGAGSVETTWSHLMAATTLSLLPILIVFFVAQRVFIQGIVFTGVKA